MKKKRKRKGSICEECGETVSRRTKCKHCGELRCTYCIHHFHAPHNQITS